MKHYLYCICLSLLLSGCQLIYKNQPDVLPNCQYQSLSGAEFSFQKLPIEQQQAGYQRVYTLYSRAAPTLNYADYVGIRGKLTDKIIIKDYPKKPIFIGFGARCSAFSDCDDPYGDNEDIYLTQEQQEKRRREARFIFWKAILDTCEVIYISVDSLTEEPLHIDLIEDAGLSVVK